MRCPIRIPRAISRDFLMYINSDPLGCANIMDSHPRSPLPMTTGENVNSNANIDRFRDPAPGLAITAVRDHRARRLSAVPVANRVDGEMMKEADRTEPPRTGSHPREFLWLLGRLFPPSLVIDVVTTTAAFHTPADQLWQRMMFYEEVPCRPPLLLRMFLPSPLKTQTRSKEVGSVVECTYGRGSLLKRITVLERPRLVRFEVLQQNLGIERCMTTVEGSYEFRADGRGTEVALTTQYRGHLRPRWLWHPFERLLAHQLHHHILAGMGATHLLAQGKTGHATS